MKSGITLAYRRKTEKVRIFIMAAGGHTAITPFVAGWREKHLGDFS